MNQTAFEQIVNELAPRYGVGEARSIARIVIEDTFHTKAYTTMVLKEAQVPQFQHILERLVAGVPVQYVLGVADFFGLRFKVNPSVLIPRQETEELVDWALSMLKHTSAPTVLDIGLGSGCIGISLKFRHPDTVLWGLEKSLGALEVARENAHELLGNQPVQFLHGDVLEEPESLRQPWDLIISNPPYIPRSEASLMPDHVLNQEPAIALFVEGADPLLFYRKIINFAGEYLRPGGFLLFECNEFNAIEVAELLKKADFGTVELRKDLSGADRMVGLRKPAK